MEKDDFVYEKWIEREPLNPKIGKLPDNVGLHECAKAFLSNMGRVEALARLPHTLISLGISKGHADVLAKVQQKNVNEIHESLRREAKWLEGVGTDAKRLANQAANSTVPMVRTAHQALVAATVMMSYGALENLMIDLRTVALEGRPELVSKTPKKLLGRRNLRDLRTTYEAMFGKGSDAPPHQLSKEFASSYGGLLVLEAVRNLFAHRSGIVDERFVERVETAPALRGLKIGEELFVDFAIARALAGVARDFGIYLIRFLDWWLNMHPRSKL